ncbi:nitrate reductase [Buttiauxella warmboldiae]|uniref:nitrate reductase (cytochrome) n=1 Tax=Buttiauxella warmboldiae TaxID=82993 RepID=A0A3N5DGK8_9ENTR|nr:nitrate reductase [Buttiauxella warmboldiae]RPH27748.1 nitrate reductase [Buttiauxella warmboldiae]
MTNIVRSTCPYCGVGCGVEAHTTDSGSVEISGDKRHPANFGRLCVKGAALGETLGLEGRLLHPEINGERVEWNLALDETAARLQAIIDQFGPKAVAFYASGQLLTEDYYAANKLMKGFIGAGNIDTNSRLCMSSAVVGYKRAFGADFVPCSYEDLEQTDLVVLAGSNAAWAHPVLYQRLVQAKQQRPQMKVVVIDPRRTATCEIADLHLALRPGSDAALFVGLLNILSSSQVDNTFDGQTAALEIAANWTLEKTADFCQLDSVDVQTFWQWFAQANRAMTLYTMGINQSASGSDKCNAIINVHLASGKIGRPGCGPFSLTGQPNAMGGREVGGLANQLACHMSFDAADIARLGRFWGSERIAETPGLMAVELFEAVGRGEVKAVWIMGTNPLVSLPDSSRVAQALANCPLVIVSDVARETDTLRYATVKFPALAWGEKNGTVTNSERRISRQRAFLPAPGEARADWWMVAQIAQRLGYRQAFNWQHPQQIFSEHAALSGYQNNGTRAFDISVLANLSREQYDALEPVCWPIAAEEPSLFRSWRPDGKFQLVPVEPCLPQAVADHVYPLILNTGRIRDQWHTMTRTGRVPRLLQHITMPFLEIHPRDAIRYGVTNKGLVRVASRQGGMVARVLVSDNQRPGSVFVPMHWSQQFARRGLINALVAGVCDPHSGQPESKQTAVRIQRWQPAWQGEIFARAEIDFAPEIQWWRQSSSGVQHFLCAADSNVQAWVETLVSGRGWQLQTACGDGEFNHFLAWHKGELQLACYAAKSWPEINSVAVLAAFQQAPTSSAERYLLLAGKAPTAQEEAGATVCSCFGVGEKTILAAIASGCRSVAMLGEKLRCGTCCGSCIPELKTLLK